MMTAPFKGVSLTQLTGLDAGLAGESVAGLPLAALWLVAGTDCSAQDLLLFKLCECTTSQSLNKLPHT